jgi:hypothetical protein
MQIVLHFGINTSVGVKTLVSGGFMILKSYSNVSVIYFLSILCRALMVGISLRGCQNRGVTT